jgi:predicted Zn-dependent protease
MSKPGISTWLRPLAVGLTIVAFTPAGVLAVGDEPKPAPKPKPKDSRLDDDQIYSVGYWQAKGGEYAAALDTLRSAKDQADPRIQTMIGFSLRKLGRVDEAMGYYQKVLAAHPERTTTRQYLGEAFLQIGDPARAKEQLAEIGKRCRVACEDYQLLADEIAKFEKAG